MTFGKEAGWTEICRERNWQTTELDVPEASADPRYSEIGVGLLSRKGPGSNTNPCSPKQLWGDSSKALQLFYGCFCSVTRILIPPLPLPQVPGLEQVTHSEKAKWAALSIVRSCSHQTQQLWNGWAICILILTLPPVSPYNQHHHVTLLLDPVTYVVQVNVPVKL